MLQVHLRLQEFVLLSSSIFIYVNRPSMSFFPCFLVGFSFSDRLHETLFVSGFQLGQ